MMPAMPSTPQAPAKMPPTQARAAAAGDPLEHEQLGDDDDGGVGGEGIADDLRGDADDVDGEAGETDLELRVTGDRQQQAEPEEAAERLVAEHFAIAGLRAGGAGGGGGQTLPDPAHRQQHDHRREVAEHVQEVDELEGDGPIDVDDGAGDGGADADAEVEHGELEPEHLLPLGVAGDRGENGVLPGPDRAARRGAQGEHGPELPGVARQSQTAHGRRLDDQRRQHHLACAEAIDQGAADRRRDQGEQAEPADEETGCALRDVVDLGQVDEQERQRETPAERREHRAEQDAAGLGPRGQGITKHGSESVEGVRQDSTD
jgi:hypothetical protein